METVNAGKTTFAVPARHAPSILRSGPWYMLGVRDARGSVIATITTRNGVSRLLTLKAALAYLEGNSGFAEMQTEALPEGVDSSTSFH
jgi:hypothetical protein